MYFQGEVHHNVYVKWLTWLDDWEMHRDNNVPWSMVGLQPWKQALEKHVQHSHRKGLANGMPSDVTLLEHNLFCSCRRVSSRWQARAHQIVHCHDSHGWHRSRRITVNHVGLISKPKDFQSNCQEIARLRLVHHPLSKSVPVEYLPVCVRGKFSHLTRGNRGLMVVKGAEQQKNVQVFRLFAMALETLLPKFKDICDGTFPNPVHEGVHEEEDISCCTMEKSYQFAKYLQQFNKLHAEWSYKVSVLTQ
ncbi:hypothetical protein TNCV_937021 [Trichonephila clavipes]|nr:hypothetical protein TNCV_937021 [Trichonephila clavipes]